MTRRALIHPRMMPALRNHYASDVTIEAETITIDPDSREEITTYQPAPGLVDLMAHVTPNSQTEVRRPDQTIVENPFTIALRGYYPTIDVEDHAIVDGTKTHNILAVRHDDTKTITFLDTEIVG